MKKISILALHLGYGGIEKAVVSLANTLSERYEVEIACCYKMYEKECFTLNDKVKVRYLMGDLKPNKKEFLELVKSHKFIGAFKEGLKSFKILSLKKINMINYIKNCDSKYVIATRDVFFDWLGEYGKSDTIKIGWEHAHYHGNMKYADNIVRCSKKLNYLVLVSNNLKKYYYEELRGNKCRCLYIPNVIDNIPDEVASLKSNRLVSVGRLSPEKGFLDLVKIYKKLNTTVPLDIIGDGSEREKIEAYIKSENIKGITLHGFRDKEYIDKILNKSSVYLMTSYTESFGIVLIEAMSHGVSPVAFDDAEGAREIISSGRNGYLIKNRNFDAYVKKVNDLLDDDSLRKRLGKEARNDSKNYTSDIIKYKWFDIIEGKYEKKKK